MFLQQSAGGIDILVNNAGMSFPIQDKTPFNEQARRTVDVNYYGTKRMLTLGGGFRYFYFHPRKLGKIPISTHIFQMGGSTTNQDSSTSFAETQRQIGRYFFRCWKAGRLDDDLGVSDFWRSWQVV